MFRFLFRLAADAHRIPADRLLQRLVTGLANRYGAAGCSLYRYGRLRATCWAPPGPPLTDLPREDRAYLHNLDGRLVQAAMRNRYFVSALDLDQDGDITQFLETQLSGTYAFAFQLLTDEGPRGALVMYLPAESDALNDGDIQALMALGEVLQVTEERGMA